MNELERYLNKSVEELEKLKKLYSILIWFMAFLGIMFLILFAVSFYKDNSSYSILCLFVLICVMSGQSLLKQNYRYIDIVMELKKLKSNGSVPSGNPAPQDT
jgi:phosphotransferase system  glucose/maltose/N-acetylglucosamine-specific IIC component